MPPAARKTPAPRKPQDHKPKATKPKATKSDDFTFEADGVTYTLPHPSAALANIDGRALRDALLNGEMGELALAFRCLEAVDAAPEAIDAIYAKPVTETAGIVVSWFRSADVSGATLPQS